MWDWLRALGRSPAAGGLAVAVLTLGLMVATDARLTIVWDEGYTLDRLVRLRAWFRALGDPVGFSDDWRRASAEGRLKRMQGVPDLLPTPRAGQLDTRAKLFQPRVITWFWPFAREEPHGHPPFYALAALLGDVVTPGREDLPRARLGTILAFSLAAGALYAFVARRWGFWPALLAAGAWALQPQMFALGHYATYDSLLTSLWVGTVLAFANGVGSRGPESTSGVRWRWVVTAGVLAGCAAGTKLTGWFLPLPFLAWAALRLDRRALTCLGCVGLVALLTVYALNPVWWVEPVAGVERFLRSNLTRGTSIAITVTFLGRVYMTPVDSLPWYNTLFWTAIVTPVGFLAFAVAGVVRVARRRRDEPFGSLAVVHWAFLLALRALPHTPGHDGVRQFLPAFGFLAVVAGLGAASAVEGLGRWGKLAVVAALAEGAVSVAMIMPVPLSYFSPIVGGLPGATALGMEPTYYWDSLTPEALDWLNRNTGPGQKILFSGSYPTCWRYLRDTGRIKPGFLAGDPGEVVWYVVQNRPGSHDAMVRQIIATGTPAYAYKKAGVPLLWVYPFRLVKEWRARHSGG